MKSWIKYRPNDSFQEHKEDEASTAISGRNFLTIVDDSFVNKIMNNVNQNNNNLDFDDDGSEMTISKEGSHKSAVPEVEINMINDFLVRFLITSISHEKDKLDLVLALRALPKHINEHNVERISLINFGAIRQSLNALRNDDNREMKRFLNLWSKSKENTDDVDELKELAFRMISKIGKMLDINPNKIIDGNQDDYEFDDGKPLKSDSGSEF